MNRLVTAAIAVVVLTPALGHAEDDRWFAHDKALHASAGGALGAGGYGAGAIVFDQRGKRFVSGVAAGLAGGAAKEWWDKGHDGDPSWRDFTWDAVGATAGAGVVWLIDRALHRHHGQPSPTTVARVIPRPGASGYEGVVLPVSGRRGP